MDCSLPSSLVHGILQVRTRVPGREAALAWASLVHRSPASSVLAREGAGCGQNFPQFIVIHTVKGYGIVNKAEIDVFFWNSLAFLMIQQMLAI